MVMVADPLATWAGVAESVPVAVTVLDPLTLYVTVTLAPVVDDKVPPGAVQLKVHGGVPPEQAALNVAAVPTVPVAGPVTVTVSPLLIVALAVAVTTLESVTVSVTVKGPADAYVCDTGLVVPAAEPSPKFQENV
jgi:hypothetical protein